MAEGKPFPRKEHRLSTLLHERYRRRTPVRRSLVFAAAAFVLVAGLAFIAWATLSRAPGVAWDDVGYHVDSDAAVEVTFDVSFTGRSDPGARATAVCTLVALNPLRTTVGVRDVPVQAGPGGRVRATATLRTSERATTGVVSTCVLT